MRMARIASSVLLLLCLLFNTSSGQTEESQITSDQMKYFYQTVLSTVSYDKRVRPNQAVSPVKVQVSLYLLRLSDWDQSSQQLKVSMYFRQKWDDDRLQHNGDGRLIGGQELSESIWKPDTMFSTSDEGRMSMTTVPNVFVRINPNGSVLHSSKLSQRITCDHSVRSFPMDRIKCKLMIESYGHSADDLVYEWQPAGAQAASDVGLQGFRMSPVMQNATKTIVLSVGNFTALELEFQLRRQAMPYLVKYFLPVILTTLLSMVPVTENRSKSAASLTSFLLTTILVILINIHVLPATAGVVTAMDAFSLTCILMTAVSLVLSLRRGSDGEGSTHKLSEKEEKLERHMKKLLPIAFLSFLLILLIVVACI